MTKRPKKLRPMPDASVMKMALRTSDGRWAARMGPTYKTLAVVSSNPHIEPSPSRAPLRLCTAGG